MVAFFSMDKNLNFFINEITSRSLDVANMLSGIVIVIDLFFLNCNFLMSLANDFNEVMLLFFAKNMFSQYLLKLDLNKYMNSSSNYFMNDLSGEKQINAF